MDNLKIINGSNEFICENLSAIEGFEFPSVRLVMVDLPNKPGSLYINSLAGRRTISWRGAILTNNQAQRRLLSLVCSPGNLKTIQFETCDGVPVQVDAEITRLINPYTLARSVYMIEAVAPSASFSSQTLHSQDIFITRISGGMPIPAAIPGPIPGGSSIPGVVINAGNDIAYPILTIRGPGTNFVIQNLDTGQKINLNITLLANETAVIDTGNGTSQKGTQSVFGSTVRTPAGGWLYLQPGSNRITFNAASGTTSNTRLNVAWRDSYSGI